MVRIEILLILVLEASMIGLGLADTDNMSVISVTVSNCNHQYSIMSESCDPGSVQYSPTTTYYNAIIAPNGDGTWRIYDSTGKLVRNDTINSYVPQGGIRTDTPSPTPIPTPTKIPTLILTNTPKPTSNDVTIAYPCEDNSNKRCESIVKDGVTVYKGLVYPETIDINNPSESIFPIYDPVNANHVGISHSCFPTGNTPTYSQICDASYINGRLTYIIKYTYREYPCSTGICRENYQESISVRAPIILMSAPTNTPVSTITNTSPPTGIPDFDKVTTVIGYGRIHEEQNEPVPVVKEKGIIEKIKEFFINLEKRVYA